MIQVGQVLDKYELLERVGQGGMAIVYRGIDRSLKRTVAIKVLHKHLADYQEARDRFEREAQAVAKLRHENILEIFDYAAREESEAYIVTEFIDGQTLKQFVTERPIAFPEVGAMIMLQVCRALAHAHAAGILHRDVKPENIMIRSDGVVKLMDFGISHMVDLERLTVTGQLLGSPAYMAPEHVEGRPLDYRTDVFAAGIVLYQLTVGKLPFEGKNPHEVLKRIAECKFVDPRQANPRIGNRLGRIILRAMAAAPADRYPAIGEMVLALEAYLEESGLPTDKLAGELARYFQSPAAYEQALHDRLVDHLTRRGQKLLGDGDQAPALDVFDRVLTIDPNNAKVLAILDAINRRARLKTAAIAIGLVGMLAFCGYMIHRRNLPPPAFATSDLPELSPPRMDTPTQTAVAHEQAPPDAAPVEMSADAAAAIVVTAPRDAAPIAAPIDGPAFETHHVRLVVAQPGATYSIDDGPWAPVPANGVIERDITAPVHVKVRNPPHFTETELHVDGAHADIPINLEKRSGSITAKCPKPAAGSDWKAPSVYIDGKPADLDRAQQVFFNDTLDIVKSVDVEFIGRLDKHQKVQVEAGENKVVTCEQP